MDGDLELLGERIAEMSAHLDAAMHRLLTDLREFDQRGGWHRQGAVSCAHWLSWRVGWDLGTAREHVRVAQKLAEVPAIDDALRRGQVSYSKVRAMTRIATPANEWLLLEYAKLMTASQLEAQCRKYALVLRQDENAHPKIDEQRRYVRRRDTEDGMVKIQAVLHPEEAEVVWTMLNHAAAQRTRHSGPSASAESTKPSSPSGNSTDAANDLTDVRAFVSTCITTLDSCAAATGSSDVPAETRVVVEQCGAAVISPHGAAVSAGVDRGTGHCDVPAETPVVVEQCRAAVISPHGAAVSAGVDRGTGHCDVPAETRVVGTPPDRSTADALGGTDAVRGGSRERLEEATSSATTGVRAALVRPQGGGSVLWQREDAAKRAFNRADALVAIAQSYVRGERPERSPIEITLTISESSLRAEAPDVVEAGEIGQSFVSREAARRLSCDAGIVETVEDAMGTPLSVGRKRRTVSGSLKRALHRRDQCCTFPGCTNRMFLEAHHIRHWADGGETSLLNSALLCSLHHRYVHEYGFTIELGPDQRPRFRDRYGWVVPPVPEPMSKRVEESELGWPRIRAMNEPLAITADAIECWDGTPVDYGTIVGHLLVADGLAT